SIRVFLYRSRAPRHPPSFPTRRSSDLLAAHPAHSRARELFDGFSAMLSFEVKGGLEAAERFIQRARLPIVAPSLGGIETLITRPATTSQSGMSLEERRQAGISDRLIRLSVGLEATEGLVEAV